MNEEELQEQLQVASQFIIDGAQEAKDFKSGGQSYEAAAETYKTLNEKAIDIMSKRPEAIVPESVYQNIQNRAAAGVRSEKCQTPTSSDLVPVLRDAYKEFAPEIKYVKNTTIKGKAYFVVGIILIVLTLVIWGTQIYKTKMFDGTAESWANRMYIANIELSEKNPGMGYDEIMKDFKSGNAEKAKEKVIRRENTLHEAQIHRKKYENKISTLLSKEYSSGVKIVEYEESTGDRYESSWLGSITGQKTAVAYSFIFMKIITLDEEKELRVAMEKKKSILEKDKWNVFVTTDKRINSVADYRKLYSQVKWSAYKNAF